MRTILLPFHGDPPDDVALETACLVAQRFKSHIEGLYVRQPPPIIAAEGITLPGDYLTQFAEESRQIAVRAEERFRAAMRERGIEFRQLNEPGDSAAAGWRDMEGLERQAVGEMGRLFDLIVVASTAEPSVPDRNATAEAALFDSGRPVLVAPPATPRTIGEVVAIMWNGSTETARTIALAMPFLNHAREVVVVTVEGAVVPGPAGEDVASHLLRNGINATASTLATDGATGGEAMLAECDRLGADLLIKGAYTQSRLRQMIFGGATRHILANARLPVLLAH